MATRRDLDRRVTWTLGAVLLLASHGQLLTALHQAQIDSSQECVSGQVLGDDGEVLAGATVRLRGVESAGEMVVSTDKRGQFSFKGCSAGWFHLVASSPRHVSLAHGAAASGLDGTPLVLTRETVLSDLTIRLPRYGVVAGVVRRSDGQPLGGVTVSAIQKAIGTSGVPYLSAIASASTTVEGHYRLPNVPPGTYVVRATPSRAPISSVPDTPVEGYAVTYYPATLNASDAESVIVSSGQTTDRLDILVRVEQFIRITGRATKQGSGALTEGDVTLDPSGSPTTSATAAARVREGTFSLLGVQPGEYLLRVSEPPATRGRHFRFSSFINLTPGLDRLGLDVVLTPTTVVSGTIASVGGQPPATAFRLAMDNADERFRGLNQNVAIVRADGAFAFTAVDAGRYRLRLLPASVEPAAWALSSVRMGESELADSYFDVEAGRDLPDMKVTVSDQLGQIVGSLSHADGAPATSFALVVFPADKVLWSAGFRRSFATRPANTGQFRVNKIPAGQYRVAVVKDVKRNQWLIPLFLEGLVEGSMIVSVEEKTSPTVVNLVVK